MPKKMTIPVHRMDDWFSGVYLKQMARENSSRPSYERSLPHRHDFYYCVLLEKGIIELEVDFRKFQLTGPSIFLSYPGQIHSILSSSKQQGWFLAFDPAWLPESLKNILDQCLSEVMLATLLDEKAMAFSSFITYLNNVYHDTSELFREPVIRSLVTSLVYQLASSYFAMEQFNLNSHPARSIEITKFFKQILRNHFKSLRKPSDYAAKMNVSLSHLNDTVRSVTGFSVTSHIQKEIMLEAQRLLSYSSLSVKEIADALGFEDESYFNRLFSKVVGVSPGAFRKKQL
jgi:AraC family transcriptional activator of pobA